MCVCVCARAHARVCVCVCMRVCVRSHIILLPLCVGIVCVHAYVYDKYIYIYIYKHHIIYCILLHSIAYIFSHHDLAHPTPTHEGTYPRSKKVLGTPLHGIVSIFSHPIASHVWFHEPSLISFAMAWKGVQIFLNFTSRYGQYILTSYRTVCIFSHAEPHFLRDGV